MKAQRIRRRRSKGWRMPEGAIYVGRPSRWGNPFAPILMGESGMWRITRSLPRVHQASASLVVLAGHVHPTYDEALADAIHLYRRRIENWIEDEYDGDTPAAMAELRGHDLACWCALDQPCHADVLLEFANRVEP